MATSERLGKWGGFGESDFGTFCSQDCSPHLLALESAGSSVARCEAKARLDQCLRMLCASASATLAGSIVARGRFWPHVAPHVAPRPHDRRKKNPNQVYYHLSDPDACDAILIPVPS